MQKYELFALDNADLIARIESTLRSLSYVIPGRFDDSIFVSEMLYAVLKCTKWFHDAIYFKHFKLAANPSWNAYLSFVKQKVPMAAAILNVLTFVKFTQVPAELLINRLGGVEGKHLFVVLVETLKALLRGALWWLSDGRIVPHTLTPDVSRPKGGPAHPAISSLKPENEVEMRLIALNACAEGKSLQEKARNYLLANAPDKYALHPELLFKPADSRLELAREAAFTVRPLFYAIAMLVAVRVRSQGRVQMAAWLGAFCLDYFACWPEIQSVFTKQPPPVHDGMSVHEIEEREFRLLRLVLCLFREPVYSANVKEWLNAAVTRCLDGWTILSPLATTARAYLRLCEESVLYTLGS